MRGFCRAAVREVKELSTRSEERVGAAMGKLVSLDASGTVSARAADTADRRRFLLEDIGIVQLVAVLPDDIPFEPPPRK
jgi:hypothetical protein